MRCDAITSSPTSFCVCSRRSWQRRSTRTHALRCWRQYIPSVRASQAIRRRPQVATPPVRCKASWKPYDADASAWEVQTRYCLIPARYTDVIGRSRVRLGRPKITTKKAIVYQYGQVYGFVKRGKYLYGKICAAVEATQLQLKSTTAD
jgi:hypothetical protein